MDEKLEKAMRAQVAFAQKFLPLIKTRAAKTLDLVTGLTRNGTGGFVIRARCQFRDAKSYPSKKKQNEIRQLVGKSFTLEDVSYAVDFSFMHGTLYSHPNSK